MNRLIWATDVHLDHADKQARSQFANSIRGEKADALLLTGDIANAKLIDRLLRDLQKDIDIPIYFNLGNHDFYGGSIGNIRRWAKGITKQKNVPINWIEDSLIELAGNTCLLGVDGWGDGRLGDPEYSDVMLNDWDLIEEFTFVNAMYDREARLKLLGKLGDSMAKRIRIALDKALPNSSKILLMTHVPPWKEATWHEGAHSNDDWLPWFSCKAVGDAIVEEMAKHPTKKVTVLCGHTHGRGYSKINEQIEVYTGGAKYHSPEVQKLFDVSGSEIKHTAPNTWFSTGY